VQGIGDFFTSKKSKKNMKALKNLIQTAREAQDNLPNRLKIDSLQTEIEGNVWISEHEAMQFFLNKCSEMNLPSSQSTYDKLLKALCKGTESQDEHFLQYLRNQQDALIAFCEKTDQDYTDEQITERYFRFEVLDKYDQESIDFWAAFA
jgi:hypothetical protein